MSAATVTRARVDAPRAGQESFAGMQRSRLLAAAVCAVDELGYPDTTVADITTRARVSRRTFYEHFADREACLVAALEQALGLVARDLEQALGLIERDRAGTGAGCVGWCERVRVGLWAILGFFDREPALARVCVVQALRGGPRVLERREAVLAGLARVVDEGRREGPGATRCTALTAEGLVGAAFSIVYARLLKGSRRPLTGLLGELMGMIVLPYLGGARARRVQSLPAPATRSRMVGRGPLLPPPVSDPLERVPMRLTYRTSRVLESVAELAGGGLAPSNRAVAERAGIHDPGQVSKLLRRLEHLELLANGSPGHARGEPNAWRLTDRGERVAWSIRAHSRFEGEVA